MNLPFYIVDVFAIEKYTGNQLAVVLNSGGLTPGEMQNIASEFNFSETTFITSQEIDGSFNVRIFTPNEEVPFAGHPTLGTAYVIQQEIIKKPIQQLLLNFKIGQIPVTFSSDDTLYMKQKEPEFGKIFKASEIARVLGINADEIDNRFPVQEISTGLPCIIVPIKNLQTLNKCTVDKEKYFKFIESLDAKAILVFCPETIHEENNFNVRFFADYYGVSEDPATGSANGCLAGYLVRHNYFSGKLLVEDDLRIEQGYKINRPSLLLLRACEADAKIKILVGGKVIMVAKGGLKSSRQTPK